ncbi:hypothetical protein [Lysinibacillus fusiformis]
MAGKTMDSAEVLALYRGEINFTFIEDPVYTDEFYLKKPECVLVLGYLFLLALMIYHVFQRRLRQTITEKRLLKEASRRIKKIPTVKYVQVIIFHLLDGSYHRQSGNL